MEIVRSLGYVDMSRVAAHGHSMGAFVTAALLAEFPSDFRAASHTAGGVRPTTSGDASALVTHELFVYPDAGHNDISLSATMFARVRAWYTARGVL